MIEAIRKLDVEGRFNRYTTATGSELETQIFELASRIRFESGDFTNVTYNHNREALFEEFEITEGVVIPPGTYTFDRVRGSTRFSGHRRFSGSVGAELGGFFGGTRTELTYRGRVEVTPQFSLEPDFAMNWIDLPQGAFQTNLIRIAAPTRSPRAASSEPWCNTTRRPIASRRTSACAGNIVPAAISSSSIATAETRLPVLPPLSRAEASSSK